MKGKYFLDTNILVYSFDASAKKKQIQAQKLIQEALAKQSGMISYQVVQEFINLARRKFEKPLSLREQLTYLDEVLDPLCMVQSGSQLNRKALRIQEEAEISFYDALIVASANEGGCKILYSEDLQHNQIISGVKVQNPFL